MNTILIWFLIFWIFSPGLKGTDLLSCLFQQHVSHFQWKVLLSDLHNANIHVICNLENIDFRGSNFILMSKEFVPFFYRRFLSSFSTTVENCHLNHDLRLDFYPRIPIGWGIGLDIIPKDIALCNTRPTKRCSNGQTGFCQKV